MSRYERFKFFSYTWSHSDEDTTEGRRCLIRAFGWNEQLEPTYLGIEGVKLPVTIELDESIDSTEGVVSQLRNHLQYMNRKVDMQPAEITFEERTRSYYAYVEKLPARDPKTGRNFTPIRSTPTSSLGSTPARRVIASAET